MVVLAKKTPVWWLEERPPFSSGSVSVALLFPLVLSLTAWLSPRHPAQRRPAIVLVPFGTPPGHGALIFLFVKERARGRLRALLAQSGCEAQGGRVHFLVLGVRIEAGLDLTSAISVAFSAKPPGGVRTRPLQNRPTGIRRRELEGTPRVITPITKNHNRYHKNRI